MPPSQPPTQPSADPQDATAPAAGAAANGQPIPSPAPAVEQATFAGGCFWCLEAVFLRMKGVVHVEPGYSNGNHPQPSYALVCGGDTGHAEVVRVHFDPSVVSYRQLLAVLFRIHDPTTLNRQGHDVGSQYRSGIYTHNEAQAAAARQVIADLTAAGAYDSPIVTEVQPVANYHVAEGEHHGYFDRNPYQGYCAMVVAPKVVAFERSFPEWAAGAPG